MESISTTGSTVKPTKQKYSKIWEADEKTQNFLDRLSVGGVDRFFQIFMPDAKKHSEWRPAGSKIVLPIYVTEAEALFFCVNPSSMRVTEEDREEYPGKKDDWIAQRVAPKNRTVAASNAVIAEFDGKDETAPTEEDIQAIYDGMRADPGNAKVLDRVLWRQAAGAVKKRIFLTDPAKYKALARARIDALDLPPSVIVDSGGGYHCYWLLRETFRITCEGDLDRLKSIYARWVARVGADPDSKDIRRLLRVPGVYNRKKAYAPDFPLVHFVKYDLTLSYTLDQIESLLPPAEVRQAPARGALLRSTGTAGDLEKPLDVYNRENLIGDVLEAAGYTWYKRDRMSRPGDEDSGGVVIDRAANRSQHWSSADPLCSEYWRRPSHVYIEYEHEGQITEAVKTLGAAQRKAAKEASATRGAMPARGRKLQSDIAAMVPDRVLVVDAPAWLMDDGAAGIVPDVTPADMSDYAPFFDEYAAPVGDGLDVLLAELGAVADDKFAVMRWALANAARCARLGAAEMALLRLELQARKVAKVFIDGDFEEAQRAAVAAVDAAADIVASPPAPSGEGSGVTWATYSKTIESLGYDVRMNDLDDTVEVNGRKLADGQEAELLMRMHDLGFKKAAWVQRSVLATAHSKRYNPIKEYLNGLVWDGFDWLAEFERYVWDKHPKIVYADGSIRPVFGAWLKRWGIGAVGKVLKTGKLRGQNPMLVLSGGQNAGKSTLARVLNPFPDEYHCEETIDPDLNEHKRFLCTKFLWEVAELGATTRKADREGLKNFLTKQDENFRVPYAHHPVTKPTTASFIGTLNPEAGFLNDPTGHRRFLVVDIARIDFSYIDKINIPQLWAQLVHLYKSGEPAALSPEEKAVADNIRGDHEMEDPFLGFVLKYYTVDVNQTGWVESVTEIVDQLLINGVHHANVTNIGVSLKRLGLESKRATVNKAKQTVYFGLKRNDVGDLKRR